MSTRDSPGVKAAGAYGWQTTTLVVPNVEMIRGFKLHGTLRATSACRGTSLLFFFTKFSFRSWGGLSPVSRCEGFRSPPIPILRICCGKLALRQIFIRELHYHYVNYRSTGVSYFFFWDRLDGLGVRYSPPFQKHIIWLQKGNNTNIANFRLNLCEIRFETSLK